MNSTDYYSGTCREWIITNGLGGYASSTTIGANTRKYHGLLIAALNPPVDRRVLLSSLDEELIIGDDIHKLAVHKYPDAIYPEGYQFMENFTASPYPFFEYDVNGIKIRKQLVMTRAENTTIVKYDIINPSGRKGTFKILPLLNNRSVHQLSKSGWLSFTQKSNEKGTVISIQDISFSLISDMQYRADEHWYYNLEYEVELSRGYPYREDNFNPGHFEIELKSDHNSYFIVASTEPEKEWNIDLINEMFAAEEERQKGLTINQFRNDAFLQKLVVAGDSFIVDRRSTLSKSVIAGYHWFGDWGRDTMIALPGLTLVTGRFSDAKSILSTFAASCRDGLIPNNFPENPAQTPAYNTVDASLWYIHAVGRYLEYTEDTEFIMRIWPTIEEIIEKYSKGTSFGIRMDEDGLIEHGGQLTWMDAKVRDWEITPRNGKACEINALWYNALMHATEIGIQIGKEVSRFQKLADMTKESFRKEFWHMEKGCLYDCISGSAEEKWKDASIRPNQIFAVSLTYTMLTPEIEKSIVDVITQELLTPYGLRTLSQADSSYKGKYDGNTENRDMAYHNGTVWPWLLGSYISAYSKVYSNIPDLKDKLMSFLSGMEKHLDEAGIGSVSEIFDGDSPYKPRGCISQAWSVAEITRCYIEDIL